jgi:hypothetical protein
MLFMIKLAWSPLDIAIACTIVDIGALRIEHLRSAEGREAMCGTSGSVSSAQVGRSGGAMRSGRLDSPFALALVA